MMIENKARRQKSKKLENPIFKEVNKNKPIIDRISSLNDVILENKNEKKYFGKLLHNNLVQVLSSLNFYVDALLHPKNIKEKSNQQFLESIKDLSQEAIEISLDVANSLISNSISEENGLLDAIKMFCEKLSRKHRLKIALALNFKESYLSIERKQQALKISTDIILYLANTGKFRNFSLEYSLKYKKRILQIEVFLKETVIHLLDIEKQNIVGYTNLKHSLDILNVRLSEKANNKGTLIIIKLPLVN